MPEEENKNSVGEKLENLKQFKRDFDEKKKQALAKLNIKKKIKKKINDKIKKKFVDLQKRAALNAIKGTTSATILAYILAYLIRTAQFIVGNIGGNKNIPKLKLFETILWACETFIVITVIMALLFSIIIIVMLTIALFCPVCAFFLFAEEIKILLEAVL